MNLRSGFGQLVLTGLVVILGVVFANSRALASPRALKGLLAPAAGVFPVAVDDTDSTDEDTPRDTRVVANDITGEQPNTLEVISAPSHGSAVPKNKNSITYTPDLNYFGPDSYVYRLCDRDPECDTATVYMTVDPVNDPPNAVDDTAATDSTTPVTIPVLSNDTDVEGDTLLLASFDTTSLNGGTIVRFDNGSPGDLSDDQVTYTPVSTFSGTDVFTYTVSDGQASSNGQVNVTVSSQNHPPVATNDSYNVLQDTTLNVSAASGVLANDTDPDSDPLNAVLDTNTTHGSLNLASDGSFTYTPDTGFAGQDTFTYHANDGALDSAPATVTISVQSSNLPPSATDDPYSTGVNVQLSVPTPGVLGNDTDPNGDPLTAVLELTTTHGSLNFSTDGSFTYTPNLDFTGQDSFTYHATDGSLDSNTATVTINVQVGNAAPNANHDSYGVPMNNALSVSAPGVLANDTDANGDALTAILDSDPAHGTLVLGADGSFSYTPDLDFFGLDTFTYHASDGGLSSAPATVTIEVLESNLAPSAADDVYSVVQGNPLPVPAPGVLANDSDANGDSLTAVLDGTTAHGTLTLNADGSFTYTPQSGFYGQDSFGYRASDGTLESQRAQVTIDVLEADAQAPQVTWISPVSDEGIQDVGDQIVRLEVSASDNVGVASVRFYRWDDLKQINIEIGIVYQPPYRWDLDTRTLNMGWNQINAKAYDSSGNSSELGYIWLVKSYHYYVPLIFR
jgi:VCBS repeat-containing protein